MAKYETAFKLKVVKSFLAVESEAKLLARRWSASETWVSHYRLHGVDGLRPKISVYSARFKLHVESVVCCVSVGWGTLSTAPFYYR